MEACKKYPQIVKSYTGSPTAATFQLQQPLILLSVVLSLNIEKSIILKGMKWKQQKDISLDTSLVKATLSGET